MSKQVTITVPEFTKDWKTTLFGVTTAAAPILLAVPDPTCLLLGKIFACAGPLFMGIFASDSGAQKPPVQ